jgi:hypothetical protein
MVANASSQAGVFAGLNPASFNASDPIVLFIIQATIILSFCRLISIPLGYVKQPRVISEGMNTNDEQYDDSLLIV